MNRSGPTAFGVCPVLQCPPSFLPVLSLIAKPVLSETKIVCNRAGRIPGFTQHIFPDDSRPFLTLTANVGLCLFLFLVGLEIDSGLIKRNAKFSVAIAFAGMALPFGLGVALSKPLYHHFIPDSVQYTHFMLFTGVAYSITAFPVLCRILTELKLLDTTIGIVVLSAGVGNDIGEPFVAPVILSG